VSKATCFGDASTPVVLAGFSPHQLLWLPPHDLLRSPQGWGLLLSWHIKSCNPAKFTQPRMHLSHYMLIHNITTQIQLNKIENINFFATSCQDDQGHLPFKGGHYFVAAPGVWVACTRLWNSSWPKVLKIILLVGSGDFWHIKFAKCLQWCICKESHGLCVFATQKCSEIDLPTRMVMMMSLGTPLVLSWQTQGFEEVALDLCQTHHQAVLKNTTSQHWHN
jgi:hypothetical protein